MATASPGDAPFSSVAQHQVLSSRTRCAVYALVNGNNFYVSCWRVFRPSLNGGPMVVLSNNDGCAIARPN